MCDDKGYLQLILIMLIAAGVIIAVVLGAVGWLIKQTLTIIGAS